MGWSGGTFSRSHNFSADASAGIQAQASRFDAEFDNVKTGLETCVTRDGQNAASGNLPMGGNRHTGVGAATSAAEYLRADQASKQTGIFVKGLVTGHKVSASATVFPAALAHGQRVTIRPDDNVVTSASGSAGTFIINGLTAPFETTKNTIILKSGNFHDYVYNASASPPRWEGLHATGMAAGSFKGLLVGMTATTTCEVNWILDGSIVTMGIGNTACTGTSNTTTFGLDGIPTQIYAQDDVSGACLVHDNGADKLGYFELDSVTDPGTIYFKLYSGAFTSSGTKGFPNGWTISYPYDISDTSNNRRNPL